jgi:hypothetical protein
MQYIGFLFMFLFYIIIYARVGRQCGFFDHFGWLPGITHTLGWWCMSARQSQRFIVPLDRGQSHTGNYPMPAAHLLGSFGRVYTAVVLYSHTCTALLALYCTSCSGMRWVLREHPRLVSMPSR